MPTPSGSQPRLASPLALVLTVAGLLGMVTTLRGQAQAKPPQTTGPAPVKLLIDSMAGADLFRAYCAACHGQDGRGFGPVAASLKMPPADLTQLARQNGNVFPAARVTSLLNGDASSPAIAAHGETAMPVWGPIFRALEAGPQADIRIANVVRHVESLQRR